MLSGQKSLGPGKPMLRETRLGWAVVGDVFCNKIYHSLSCSCTSTDSQQKLSLADTMRRFWELEEIKVKKFQSYMEVEMEKHFVQTYQRLLDGRFIVKLPFQQPPEILGESRAIAIKRLATIEKKLKSQPELSKQYTEFMDEYIELTWTLSRS